jgi:DNA polymerase-3 subunit alpha (Gram-positive type)
MPNQSKKENHPLRSLCYDGTQNLYGDYVPEKVELRMEEELQHILKNEFAEPYLDAARIVDKARAEGYVTTIRGSVGASFVAYLLGISEINPLSPHYRCQHCKSIEWTTDSVNSGFDLPNKLCPECGGDCRGDGHNIPYEMFLGINGDKSPNIDLYIEKEFEESARNELKLRMESYATDGALLVPDLLVNDRMSIMKRLHTLTGVNPGMIPMNDPKVLSLFRSTAELGITSEQIKTEVATYGIPEMGIRKVREMLAQLQPSSFSELVQINGLSHGTGTWEGNARERIQEGAGSLMTSIGCKEQLMLELMDYGMEADNAYAIMESVRKGKGISDSCHEAMLKCNVQDWFIKSCWKINYLFPKSHAVMYAILAEQFAYFKLYYPLEFYAANFIVRSSISKMELYAQGSESIMRSLEEIQDEADRPLLELALEMTARGLRIKKTALSESEGYVIESDHVSLEIPLK